MPFEGGSGVRQVLFVSCCCEAWEICDVVGVQGFCSVERAGENRATLLAGVAEVVA